MANALGGRCAMVAGLCVVTLIASCGGDDETTQPTGTGATSGSGGVSGTGGSGGSAGASGTGGAAGAAGSTGGTSGSGGSGGATGGSAGQAGTGGTGGSTGGTGGSTGGTGGSTGGTGGSTGGTGGGTGVWQPAPRTTWQWQLTGTIDTTVDAAMFDIDLEDTSASTISTLHGLGRIVICYFSAGSWEEWRNDAGDFPSSVLGNELDGWPDERWLDIRQDSVRDIMGLRMDMAVQKGCDGVEPDNVDGYQNDPGFSLSGSDQLNYNRFLATEAHARGLSIGLKNDLDQVGDLLNDFDWALNEECFQWDECDTLTPFIQAGKAVFHVEYGNAGLATQICPQAQALEFSTLIKKLDLDAWRVACD